MNNFPKLWLANVLISLAYRLICAEVSSDSSLGGGWRGLKILFKSSSGRGASPRMARCSFSCLRLDVYCALASCCLPTWRWKLKYRCASCPKSSTLSISRRTRFSKVVLEMYVTNWDASTGRKKSNVKKPEYAVY